MMDNVQKPSNVRIIEFGPRQSVVSRKHAEIKFKFWKSIF